MKTLTGPELDAKLDGSFTTIVSSEMWARWQIAFLINPEVGHLSRLSRLIAQEVNTRGGSLLVITQTGVFPSSENMQLVQTFRRAFGENRSVHDAPAHVFGVDESDACRSMVFLCLCNFWDFTLISETRDILVQGSHDEWIHVYTLGEPGLQRLRASLRSLGLKELTSEKPSEVWDEAAIKKLRLQLRRDRQNAALRVSLARALCEAVDQAQEADDTNRYEALLAELVRLSHRYRHDKEVAEATVQALDHALRRVIALREPGRSDALLNELQKLAAAHPRYTDYVASMRRWVEEEP